MRDLIRIIEVTMNNAMFWISDDGRLLDCSGWTHEGIAQREIPEAGDGDASIAAYRQGWIRVLGDGSIFGADWMDGRPTPDAFDQLGGLIRELPEYDVYYLNDGEDVVSKRLAISKAARLGRENSASS